MKHHKVFYMIVLAIFLWAGVFKVNAGERSTVRDLRFVMTNLYFNPSVAPEPTREIELLHQMGIDELWITNRSEYGRLMAELESAHNVGDFLVIPGLASAPSQGENQYVNPYIDVSVVYDPRKRPLGDVFGGKSSPAFELTGVDHPTEPIRTALLGRDQPGDYLVAGVYWKDGLGTNHEPGGDEARTYRFNFPLRLEGDTSALPPTARVATLFIEEEKHDVNPPVRISIVAEKEVLAGDLGGGALWTDITIFTNQLQNQHHQIELKVRWEGIAGVSVGLIGHEHWDPVGDRSMLDALDDDILNLEPITKYGLGMNIFHYLDGLHQSVDQHDPQLFDHLGGFWLIDEPAPATRQSWQKVAGQIEDYFSQQPGYLGLQVMTNFNATITDPNSRFFKVLNLDEGLAFEAPIYSFDRYPFTQDRALCGGANEEVYQNSLERTLDSWFEVATHARAAGQPSQNLVDIRNITFVGCPVTDAEVSLQAYLSLALGIDRIGFWHIGWAFSGITSPVLSSRGQHLQDLLDELTPIKDLYENLHFVDFYRALDGSGHLISDITDLTGQHGTDLRIQIGEFAKGADPYVWLVNRHTRLTDHLDLRIEVNAQADQRYRVIDVATGNQLTFLDEAHRTLDLNLRPGTGQLLQLRRAPVAYVTSADSGRILFVDVETHEILDAVVVGRKPTRVAMGPGGNRIYVTDELENTLVVVNSRNKQVESIIELTSAHPSPRGVLVSPDGTRVYVASASGSLLSVDTTTNQVVGLVAVGNRPEEIAITPQGDRLYITISRTNEVAVIDTELLSLVTSIPVGNEPIGLAMSPSGEHVYVANHGGHDVSVIDTETNTVVDVIDLTVSFPSPKSVAFTPDGHYVYVTSADGGRVLAIDAATNLVSDVIPVGVAPDQIAVTADGTRVYVTDRLSNTVIMIPVATNQVADVVAIPAPFPNPQGIAISPLPTWGPQLADLNADGLVDLRDVLQLFRDRNKPVENSVCGLACDLNGDGVITVIDARKMVLLCTQSRCQ